MSQIKYTFLLVALLSIGNVYSQSIFDVYRDSTELVPSPKVESPVKSVIPSLEEEATPTHTNETIPRDKEEVLGVNEETEETQETVVIEEIQPVFVPEPEIIEAPTPSDDADINNPFEVDHIPIRKNQIKERKKEKSESVPLSVSPTTKMSKNDIKMITPLVILLFSGILLGIVLFNNRRLVSDLRMSILNKNAMNNLKGRFGKSNMPLLGLLYIIFGLNASLFINLVINQNTLISPYKAVLYLTLIVLLAYCMRHVLLWLFGWIFELNAEASAYSFVIAIVNFCIGLLLIPVNLFLAFGPDGMVKPLMHMGIAIILLFGLFRYFRFFMIGSKYLVARTFQFFLYFCTFEIAPLLIILYGLRLI